MKEIIQEARNVDEAIELACKALGVERDGIEFEIITLPKRGFLGLMNTRAKVRVYVEEPEIPVPAPRPRPAERPAPRQEQRPERREKPQSPPQPRVERPAPKPEMKAEPAPVSAPEAEAKPAVEITFISADEVEGKAKTAAAYVKDVLAEMGVDAKISVGFTENGIILRLSGDGLGVIIGRRGETLDALQYLSGLVSNREEGEYMRVTIDSGNYREKRERTLEQLARKLSISAVRRGRPSTLEPMNPYERRIIHATVSKIEGVSSSSLGEEPNRRVVITPDNMKPQAPRSNKGPGSGPRRDSRGPRDNRGPRDSAPREGGALREDAPRDGGAPRETTPREGGAPRESAPRFNNGPRDSRGPRDGGGRFGSGPRRDSRGPREGGRTESVTPTQVDRAYAKEIEREAAAYVKPDPAEAVAPRENTTPARETARKEGDDLPLYGKIEL